MNTLFLKFYVAAKVRVAARPEAGFVTAEHLALAVAGIVIAGVAVAFFNGDGGVLDQIKGKVDINFLNQ